MLFPLVFPVGNAYNILSLLLLQLSGSRFSQE